MKIAEGCDYKCAFCIIPTLRGQYRSRPADSIVREARALAARGVKELLLISQDTTFYGIDRGERGALARLLRELNAVDGLEWIRLLYLYPTTIDDDTLAAMAECEKVCNYIDLPLQHASNPVLKRMKRPGHAPGLRPAARRASASACPASPSAPPSSSASPAKPTQTSTSCASLSSDHAFDHVGVFTYSHEEGTSAYSARRRRAGADEEGAPQPGDGPAEAARPARGSARGSASGSGSLVDGPSADHELVLKGRLASQAPDIDASVFLTDCDPSTLRPGDFSRGRDCGRARGLRPDCSRPVL